MKWTKLRFSESDIAFLSSYELPWQAALSRDESGAKFKIRYLGPLGGVSRWFRQDGASVLYEKGSNKVLEVKVSPSAFARDDKDAFFYTVKEFLESDHDGITADEQNYLNVIREAADKTHIDFDDAAAA